MVISTAAIVTSIIATVVSAIIIIALSFLYKRIMKKVETAQVETQKIKKENEAIRGGVLALLRTSMIKTYIDYKEKGYVPIFARDAFDDTYEKYHALGGNGVIDDIRDKLFELPAVKPKKQ